MRYYYHYTYNAISVTYSGFKLQTYIINFHYSDVVPKRPKTHGHKADSNSMGYHRYPTPQMWPYGCAPLGWSGSRSVIQDLSGSWCNKETVESRQILDHWSWSRSPQRNAAIVSETLNSCDTVCHELEWAVLCSLALLWPETDWSIRVGKQGCVSILTEFTKSCFDVSFLTSICANNYFETEKSWIL